MPAVPMAAGAAHPSPLPELPTCAAAPRSTCCAVPSAASLPAAPDSQPRGPTVAGTCRSTASPACLPGRRGGLRGESAGELAALVLLAAPVLPEVIQKSGQTVKIGIGNNSKLAEVPLESVGFKKLKIKGIEIRTA